MSVGLPRSPKRRGATIVLVAVCIPLLLGLAAVTVDLGHLYCVRTELQNAADAAALAGASGLPDEWEVRERAQAIARANTANGHAIELPDDGLDVGFWDSEMQSFTTVPEEDDDIPDACRVKVRLDEAHGNAVELSFGQIFGWRTAETGASAVATFGTAQTYDVMIVQDVSYSFRGALGMARLADEGLLGCLKDHVHNDSRVGLAVFTGTGQVVKGLEELELGADLLAEAIREIPDCCGSVFSWSWRGSSCDCAADEVYGSDSSVSWSSLDDGFDVPAGKYAGSCDATPACDSYTNIAAGINAAGNEFVNASLPDPERGRAIVLVSDGQPKAPSGSGYTDQDLRDLAIQAVDEAWAMGISVYAVYYAGSSSTPDADVAFLERLVRGEGTFQSTPDPDELSATMWNICASLPLMLVE